MGKRSAVRGIPEAVPSPSLSPSWMNGCGARSSMRGVRPTNGPGAGLPGRLHPPEVSPHFVIPASHLEPEGDRLRMDAMGTAHHRGVLMLKGPLFDPLHESLDVG